MINYPGQRRNPFTSYLIIQPLLFEMNGLSNAIRYLVVTVNNILNCSRNIFFKSSRIIIGWMLWFAWNIRFLRITRIIRSN